MWLITREADTDASVFKAIKSGSVIKVMIQELQYLKLTIGIKLGFIHRRLR